MKSAICRSKPRGKSSGSCRSRPLPGTGREELVHVDVRVFASTSKNMDEEMAAGNFRQDLFYRLSVVPIQIPPLKDRREDIPVLFRYYLEQAANQPGPVTAADV